MKHTFIVPLTPRIAASILALGFALPLGAQDVGYVQLRQRDSSIVRPPTRATLDSIATLMRALNNELPGSTESAALRRLIDSLLPGSRIFVMQKPSGLPKGWVGFSAQGPKHEMIGPDQDVIQYLDYPSIIAVDPDSPAQRAGIATGDMLIAYNGIDVRGREFNLTRLLQPQKKLAVTIRRDGETKNYSMTVSTAPERISLRRLGFDAMPAAGMVIRGVMKGDDGPVGTAMPRTDLLSGMAFTPRMFMPGAALVMSVDGAFGATLSDVNAVLAKTLKLEPGVLVNDVKLHTPASEAGLRAGDVIVSAADQPVGSLRALHELIAQHLADQSIAVQVMRDRKPRKLTVSW